MQWNKVKAATRGDNINGGKLGNSAVWQAKSNGLIFTVLSNRKAGHGGWLLRWKSLGTGFPNSLVVANFNAAKSHAAKVAAAATT